MKSFRKIIKLIGINALVLLALLGIVEIILRVMGKGYSNSPTDADPVLAWVHPTNYLYRSYSITGEFGNFMVYFDSLGRRSQLPEKAIQHRPGDKQVAFLGDSFVEALQVPYDSCFTGILAGRFPAVSFLNYGVTGYGPVLYYLQCKKMLEVHHVTPAAVCMVLYSNDVRDDSSFLHSARYRSSTHEIIAVNGGEKNSLQAFLRKLYLARICKMAWLKWKFSGKTPSPNNKLVKGQVEENPTLENTVSAQYILKTDSLCKAHHIVFYLTAIPSRYVSFTGDTSACTFARRAAEWSAVNRIPFINLSPTFDSLGIQARQQLFFNADVHCTASGQRAIAEVLAKELLK